MTPEPGHPVRLGAETAQRIGLRMEVAAEVGVGGRRCATECGSDQLRHDPHTGG